MFQKNSSTCRASAAKRICSAIANSSARLASIFSDMRIQSINRATAKPTHIVVRVHRGVNQPSNNRTNQPTHTTRNTTHQPKKRTWKKSSVVAVPAANASVAHRTMPFWEEPSVCSSTASHVASAFFFFRFSCLLDDDEMEASIEGRRTVAC